MTRSLRAAFIVAAIITIPLASAAAQDTLQQAVRLVLRYDPNTKPGVVVLRVAGAAGDSVRAILQRDFDYGDRINVIAGDEAGLPDSPTAGKNGTYPLFAKLGAHGIVQATITAAGVHVALHDVSQQKVVRVRDFALSGNVNSREWRMSVHNVADDVEGWISGTRGIASTRVAYIQGVRNGRLYVVDSDGARCQAHSQVSAGGLNHQEMVVQYANLARPGHLGIGTEPVGPSVRSGPRSQGNIVSDAEALDKTGRHHGTDALGPQRIGLPFFRDGEVEPSQGQRVTPGALVHGPGAH